MIFKAIISTLAFLSYASGAVLDVSVSKDVEATPSTSITTGSAIAILASGVYVASGSTNGNVASTPASGATNQVMRAFADNGTSLYTEQIAATGSEATFLASATDADDNIYQVGMCVGSWYGGLWRGNGDVCVAKYDPSGNYILSVQTGSPDYNSPTAIALNPDQSFYTVGISGGGAWNDIPGIGPWDAFVIKYANTGTVAKVARFGVKGLLTTFTGAAIDSLGNLWAVGYTSGDYRGNSSTGGSDVLLQKMNANLDVLFSTLIGGTGNDQGNSICIDSSDNVYVTGYSSSAGFNGVPALGSNDVFLSKFGNNGAKIWSKVFGGTGADVAKAVFFDKINNLLLITGSTASTTFNDVPNSFTSGIGSSFLLAVNLAGTVQGTRVYSGSAASVGNGVVSNGAAIFLIGTTTGSFQGQTISAAQGAFVLKIQGYGGAPSAAPTPSPTRPSAAPTTSPSVKPTATPSAVPTAKPTATPSAVPTAVPTAAPSAGPTAKPTTSAPSVTPSAAPSFAPTAKPTVSPTAVPTAAPSAVPTAVPTAAPSAGPTAKPTTSTPSVTPSAAPSFAPTAKPTVSPTAVPTAAPSAVPTAVPTVGPTLVPTASPSADPTVGPTVVPSEAPTLVPTSSPSADPTSGPTTVPTPSPTLVPSANPSAVPSAAPTKKCLQWTLGELRETCSATCLRTARVCKETYFADITTQESFHDMVQSAVNARTGEELGVSGSYCAAGINALPADGVPVAMSVLLASSETSTTSNICSYPVSATGSAALSCDADVSSHPARRFCPCVNGACDSDGSVWVQGYSGDSCEATCTAAGRSCNEKSHTEIWTDEDFVEMIASAITPDGSSVSEGPAPQFCADSINSYKFAPAPATTTFIVPGPANKTLCTYPVPPAVENDGCDVSFPYVRRFCSCKPTPLAPSVHALRGVAAAARSKSGAPRGGAFVKLHNIVQGMW